MNPPGILSHLPLGKLTRGLALVAFLSACPEPGSPPVDGGPTDAGPDAGVAFTDHTRPRIETRAEFEAWAERGPSRAALKFLITSFSDPDRRDLGFMDSAFYTLHDEWYWFRLLNGEPAPGSSTSPVTGHAFATLAEVYAWAKATPSLPLDLTWVNGSERLYSPEFYRLALDTTPKVYGLGSVLHVPAKDELPERWAFELEYSDRVTHAELVVYFAMLTARLPPDVAEALHWVVRSPEQEALARAMEQTRVLHHDRILRYRELARPGEVEVYSPGLTAGRVFAPGPGEELSQSRAYHVLVLDHVPDYLPQAAALLTAVPQTPLAHINVLAQNRGIPNVYAAGITESLEIDQLARINAPVAIRAERPDRFELKAMTEAEYATYRNLGRVEPAAVTPVDTSTLPYVIDLAQLRISDAARLRPAIGGKCAGFLALLAAPGVELPERPRCLTIRAYVEHIQPLRATIAAMLADPSFVASPKIRSLVLEGEADTLQRFGPDRRELDPFLAAHPEASPLGQLARAGGLVRAIRALPMNPATVAAITAALRAAYDDYAPTQGIRFRSSSSVEDIEGFNGAGLYDSNTGFFEPAVQPDPSDQKKSFEVAIKRTWSSYWGFEGFEERRLEAIDHESGNMAVLVHARSDDAAELANGVATLTLYPPDHPLRSELFLNLQAGALPVTNPPLGSDALPEVDRVVVPRVGERTIERVRASTEVEPGGWLASEAELVVLHDWMRDVTRVALDEARRGAPPEQAPRALVLDFELKHMAAGWPATLSRTFPARWMLKQARALEPGLRKVPEAARALPIPREVLSRASRVVSRACTGPDLELTLLEATTSPTAEPDLGYRARPFLAELTLRPRRSLPPLTIAAGSRVRMLHPSFAHTVRSSPTEPYLRRVEVGPGVAAALGFTALELGLESVKLIDDSGETTVAFATCADTLLSASPEDYLLELLETPR